jgi:hypothetical protein
MKRAVVRCFILGVTIIAIDVMLLTGGCAQQDAASKTRSAQGADLAPAGAQLVAIGTLPLSFVMAQPGIVTIVDITTSELKHTATITDPISARGLLTIDPVDRAIVVSPSASPQDRIVLLTPIEPEHRYAIYFSPLKASDMPPGRGGAALSPATRPAGR